MLMKKMVIAKNSGGPVETVENGVTGFLCGDDASSWSEVIMENSNFLFLSFLYYFF
jgi:glycosyltransferase involved in cell wall biosynthesis